MHAHFGDPIEIDGGYFFRLPSRKKGLAIEEGYRIYDLDTPVKAVDLSGREIGSVQVIETRHTKLNYLEKRDIQAIKKLGLKSKEEATRILSSRYSKKVKWVTFIRFLIATKLINLEHIYKKEGKNE